MWPNKSLEPTAVGAVSSAVAVHVASRRWLSFFSLGHIVRLDFYCVGFVAVV
jgi:hypothetical protein